jgi:hypothetical protein
MGYGFSQSEILEERNSDPINKCADEKGDKSVKEDLSDPLIKIILVLQETERQKDD